MKRVLSIFGAVSGALLLRASLLEPTMLDRGQAWPMGSVQHRDEMADSRLYILPGSEPITISVQDGRLHDVFGKVAQQAKAQLWMSSGVENPYLSYSATGAPVREVLSELCAGDRCRWKMVTSIVVWDDKEPTPEWSLLEAGTKSCP